MYRPANDALWLVKKLLASQFCKVFLFLLWTSSVLAVLRDVQGLTMNNIRHCKKKKKKNQCTLSSLVCDLNWTCLYLLKITQGDTAQPWMHSSNCCGRKTSLSEVNKTMKISASILFFLAKTLYWHFWFGVELLMRLTCVSIDSLSNNNIFFFSFPFWHRPH